MPIPPLLVFCPRHSSSSLLHFSSLLLSPLPMLLLPLPLWLRVPVCLYVTSVKLSGSQAKVNSPALGSGVTGSQDVFPQEPRDPWRLRAGAREGPGGEDDPLSCPPQEQRLLYFFLSISIFSFPLLSCSSTSSSSFWLFHSFSLCICVHKALQQRLLLTRTIIHQRCHTLV